MLWSGLVECQQNRKDVTAEVTTSEAATLAEGLESSLRHPGHIDPHPATWRLLAPGSRHSRPHAGAVDLEIDPARAEALASESPLLRFEV